MNTSGTTGAAIPRPETSRGGLTRRGFATATLGATAAIGLPASAAQAAPAASQHGFDPTDWGSVRDQFALSRDYLQFSAFVLASHPRQVRDAIERHRDALDADPIAAGAGFIDQDRSLEVRASLAGFLGTDADDVALTDSTTMGLALLYGGLRMGSGQEMVTSEHDFYATHQALRLRHQRDGVPVRKIRLYDDPAMATTDEIVTRIVRSITPRTRVLALTWVNSDNGVKLPARAIADALRDINARRDLADHVLFCLDGVHGFAAENSTMTDLGCDFFATSTHKWLHGPRGTGLLWGKPEHWPFVAPVIPNFSREGYEGWVGDRDPVAAPAILETPGGYHSFEHRWAVPAAVRFHETIGRARIAERITSQATLLKDELERLPNVRVLTPRDPSVSAGVVCCTVEGWAAADAEHELRAAHKVIATETPYAHPHLRFGPTMVTAPEQIGRVVKAVRALR
ncbi:selenocysteine lyase/cysteine desulfurase [Streptomyces sp. V4I8]|uniref:aminotransferase class V-fold PLP-dependent enzyme n=1 Tax=Streptomyces sp. V4I8 TaxID=3156469 RepID=UPI0035119DE0